MGGVRVVNLSHEIFTPIAAFGSAGAASIAVADGQGEAHIYSITFDPGGFIGPHRAGFGQLFLPTVGSGWVAGEDGDRSTLSPGQAGYISRGEIHSKGSEGGMTALMVQVKDLTVTRLVLGT